MKGSFRLSMLWLHTWAGVVAGSIIFLIFFNGTAAYFGQEITTWMEPQIVATMDIARSVMGAQALLAKRAPDASVWTISIPDARRPVSDIS